AQGATLRPLRLRTTKIHGDSPRQPPANIRADSTRSRAAQQPPGGRFHHTLFEAYFSCNLPPLPHVYLYITSGVGRMFIPQLCRGYRSLSVPAFPGGSPRCSFDLLKSLTPTIPAPKMK